MVTSVWIVHRNLVGFLLSPLWKCGWGFILQYSEFSYWCRGASQVVNGVKNLHKRCGYYPWVGKIPWSRKWQPTPVFLPGKFERQATVHEVAKSQTQWRGWAWAWNWASQSTDCLSLKALTPGLWNPLLALAPEPCSQQLPPAHDCLHQGAEIG